MTATPSPLLDGASAGPRRLTRSATDRVLTGLCGGIAAYLRADPSVVRLATVVLAVLTGIVPLAVLYVIAALVIPEDGAVATPDGVRVAPVAPGQGALVIGALLITLGGLALANELFRIDWDVLWPFGLVALGAVLVLGALSTRREVPR